MTRRSKPITLIVVTLCLHLFFCADAHAYLDLGTGSYIFQLLLAGLLGVLFAIKMYWRSLKNFIRRLLSRNRDAGERTDA